MPDSHVIDDLKEVQKIKYEATTKYKLIYIFCVHDDVHKDILKIGDASVETELAPDQLLPNCSALNKAAKDRINQYSNTIGVSYHLLYTEIAVKKVDNGGKRKWDAFRDYDVHKVLLNSGFKKVRLSDSKANEWFKVDLETAKNAIKAVKENRKSLYGSEITPADKIEIILREEQEDAIHKTIEVFKHGDQMLWNAKMRYGKTITALTFIKRQLNKYKKTLIITHRPVVESGWREDFKLVFKDDDECTFNVKTSDNDADNAEESAKIDYANEVQLKQLVNSKKPFIYFASIQDLRGSKLVGGKHNKNNAVFNTDWDLIINDEAHEGTQTDLGFKVAAAIKKKNTKLLSLSGTPFNIIYQYDDDAVYTWDYIMEQARKNEWDKTHPGDPNPYDSLPQMHIFTYDLGDIIGGYSPELDDKAFNFSEFFRVWTGDPQYDGCEVSPDCVGEFKHKSDIEKFLNLITTKSEDSAYPFSTDEYRDMFRHSLWMIPGVKEAKALSKLLSEHPIFGNGNFGIANVAGEGDDYEYTHSQSALDKVNTVISENDYSITLSCGKLTTGVTVREWTAVFMLSGTYNTGAANYLQTIFRVQSPGNINGRVKEHCYVFDFAPDRTLKVVAEAAKVSRKGGTGGTSGDEERRKIMAQFLNFCPVIAISGTTMRHYDVDNMMQQIKRIYVERAINSGFEDSSIYNDKLLALDKLELAEFEKLKKIVGSTKANKSTGDVPVNEQGFTEEQYEQIQKLKKKKKRELTPEEKEALEKLKKQREEKNKAESILRSISVRFPLLIFGADVPLTEDITIDKFIDIVDNESWKEFMPARVTKQLFKKFTKYYDKDIFIATAKEIRLIAKRADALLPTERVQKIAEIHSKFKNPDKETVLTPWRVVNLHMSDCLGGYSFYEVPFGDNNKLEIPRFVDRGKVTEDTLDNPNAQILEINSKTGLYPLYVAYSLYRAKCTEFEKTEKGELTDKKQQEIWSDVIQNNLYVICKTPMAKSITKRTLVGYKDTKINAHSFDDLINQLKNKPDQFIKKVTRGSFWNKKVSAMKFDAVVGNPPYQETIGSEGNQSLSSQLYPSFIQSSIMIGAQYVSLITPSRWFKGDAQDKSFIKLREFIKNNNHMKEMYLFPNANDIFSNVVIKGGVAYFLYDSEHIGLVDFYNCKNGMVILQKRKLFEDGLDIILDSSDEYNIIKKITETSGFSSLMSITNGRNTFGIIGKESSLSALCHNAAEDGDIKLYCKNSTILYVERKAITKNANLIDKYKIFISKSAGDPAKDTKVIGRAIIGSPNTACTDSLFPVGCFDDKIQAINLQKYFETKFLRYLVSILKVSQNVTQIVYRFVPMQDFTNNSDIDWSKSISEIDQQLYAKYGLTEEEIDFIENNVKSMEDTDTAEEG